MNKLLAAAAILLAAALPGHAQDFSKVEIRTTRLTDTIYMMVGAGGNLGVSVGEDAVFVIDDQFAPLTGKIREAIAKVTDKPVRFILNTHWHFDHTGGNENFGKAGALIVAHRNVRTRMSSDQFIAFMKRAEKAAPQAALPVVTFDGTVSFHLNGDEIRAIHMPRAHTDGDSIVHFVRGNVVHMGDIYFNGFYPFIDTSSGGTVSGVIAACDQVLGMVDDRTRIIPGHGPLSSKAELEAYRDMLATVRDRIARLLAEGKSLQEIQAAGVTRDYDARWGKGFMKPDRFVEMLVDNLRRTGAAS